MRLRLVREPSSATSTLSVLFLDGHYYAFMLEDVLRERAGVPVSVWKVTGKTAIPAGLYQVVISRSERFSREASARAGAAVDVETPELVHVSGFSGIRIHPGNTAVDTEGCLLPGFERQADRVLKSRPAYVQLLERLRAAERRGEANWIAIENPLEVVA